MRRWLNLDKKDINSVSLSFLRLFFCLVDAEREGGMREGEEECVREFTFCLDSLWQTWLSPSSALLSRPFARQMSTSCFPVRVECCKYIDIT